MGGRVVGCLVGLKGNIATSAPDITGAGAGAELGKITLIQDKLGMS